MDRIGEVGITKPLDTHVSRGFVDESFSVLVFRIRRIERIIQREGVQPILIRRSIEDLHIVSAFLALPVVPIQMGDGKGLIGHADLLAVNGCFPLGLEHGHGDALALGADHIDGQSIP